MPILTVSMRSQDLDLGNDAKKTFRLDRSYKFKYLKLLHIYHNISFDNKIEKENNRYINNRVSGFIGISKSQFQH